MDDIRYIIENRANLFLQLYYSYRDEAFTALEKAVIASLKKNGKTDEKKEYENVLSTAEMYYKKYVEANDQLKEIDKEINKESK